MITDWSHPTWQLIHLMAYKLVRTDGDAKVAFSLIKELFSVLPCPICKRHALSELKNQSAPVDTKQGLAVAMWQFHNLVNQRTGKKPFPWRDYLAKYSEADPLPAIVRFTKVFRNLASLFRNNPSMNRLPGVSEKIIQWCRYKSGRPEPRKVRRMGQSIGMNFT